MRPAPPGIRPDVARRTRVALVTGASSGIGAALAQRLAVTRGYRLLLSGRDRERLRSIARFTGGTALPADLSADDGGERLASTAMSTAGRVDLLIAAAGVGWCGRFEEMPLPAVDRVLAVDLIAVIHLVRLLLPHMIARGSGVIALIGSVAGCAGVGEEAVYSAAKAGLATFAESLRQELRGSGVKVTLVVPGVVQTPFFDRRGTPYLRTYPRPVPASQVADATLRAIERGRPDVYIPRWMELPGRVRGLAPGLYRALAARFG
jgi:short-subunit dehydrogenase